MNQNVSLACVFTSRKGFDYILISYGGVVQWAELFYLKFQKLPLERSTKIIYLSYDEESRLLVAINDSGIKQDSKYSIYK